MNVLGKKESTNQPIRFGGKPSRTSRPIASIHCLPGFLAAGNSKRLMDMESHHCCFLVQKKSLAFHCTSSGKKNSNEKERYAFETNVQPITSYTHRSILSRFRGNDYAKSACFEWLNRAQCDLGLKDSLLYEYPSCDGCANRIFPRVDTRNTAGADSI